jgi:hypothetical protein
MLVDYANPKHVERMMETARALERITGVNAAGHRHIRSSYFSGAVISEEGVWEYSKPYSYLILHPALALVEYNGCPAAKKLLLDLADGLLAHRRKDARGNWVIDTTINYRTDEGTPSGLGSTTHLFWAAFRWTGDKKYLQPLMDQGVGILGSINGNALDMMDVRSTWGAQIAASTTPRSGGDLNRHIAWQVTGNKAFLEGCYADQIEAAALREYINTEGSLWSDRVSVANGELQRARLGGIAIVRSAIYPGHAVSWRFKAPSSDESVAILVNNATPTGMKIIAYALDPVAVNAVMTAWDIEPGVWEIAQGTDRDGDDIADTNVATKTTPLERTGTLEFSFDPKATTVVTLRLKTKGVPYWARPDLGVSREDVTMQGSTLRVRVHNIGAADAPASSVALKDGNGRIIASAAVRALKAPTDLLPKTADAVIEVPAGTDLTGCIVQIDPEGKLEGSPNYATHNLGCINEITVINNHVKL